MASRKAPARPAPEGDDPTPAKKVVTKHSARPAPADGKRVVRSPKPPRVRERTRKIFARGDPDEDELDGDELPEPAAVRKSLRQAVAKMPNVNDPRARARSRQTDDEIDAQDDDSDLGHFEMEGVPQHSRRTMELEAQMAARLHNEPIFPYPPELPKELRPYWLELVNSFPKDHFRVSDITMMKMYCQCAYDIERQSIKIGEEGEVVIGSRGQAIVNPRCKVRESNRATLLALATKFRNQPASRQNTVNFSRNARKAGIAAEAAQTLAEDDEGLLARPGEDEDLDDLAPPTTTRH